MGALCCKLDEIDASQGPELEHFHLLKMIGQGTFGKVRIVQHKQTKKKYALKYMDKSKCIQQRAVHNILFERDLLECIEYPFITNMRYTFQDDETLFMALDLMLGGDLRQGLNKQHLFNELQVRHHVATIALSLHYLHKQHIVHRDVKPDNILLDKRGYAHLSDFNIAVQLTPTQPFSWSIAGTTAYMAPEILARKGYSTCVDWWSLGIVTYELLFGTRPFTAQSKEALSHAIIHDPLVFPDNVYETVSRECIDVITGLLDKSPFQRLGCNTNGFEKFKRHPWFHGLDWDLLERKQLHPNIDNKHLLSRQQQTSRIQEDNLISHKRTIKRTSSLLDTGSPVTKEAKYRIQLEDEFLNFDYSQHQMIESSFLEKKRNSLRKQYDRLKRLSQEIPILYPPYSD
ncbi:kinase-like domain-containing protein [Cokeromyces recurvatus]|uniref:kinase-like domain-containing protein n=1 Tax=Cokeromyces recurvatus TaxID=90255 RepID=UPI0022201CA3|nr:kinase-like domain-containing protein [Cokeromyces recurvatus]KAI7903605.1 kinase-like domain-containing protein [Cokeromyces recurvatus]